MDPGMNDEVILQTAYAADRWSDFGVGMAGAAAALAGLVFVAVSINLSEILKYRNLPGRAAQTLMLFITPLLAAIFLLVPRPARCRPALGTARRRCRHRRFPDADQLPLAAFG